MSRAAPPTINPSPLQAFVGNADDNLRVLDHLVPATVILEIIEKTEGGGLTWVEVAKTCYRTTTETQTIMVSALGSRYVLDVYDVDHTGSHLALSQNASFDPNVEELWKTVDSLKHQDEDLIDTLQMAQYLENCRDE